MLSLIDAHSRLPCPVVLTHVIHLCNSSDPSNPCINNYLAFSQEQNPSSVKPVSLDKSHDSALWAGTALDHTGFEEKKNGRGI